MKFFITQLMKQCVVLELDATRFLLATIKNSRHPPGVTQAAARTRSLLFARLRDDFNCHIGLQLTEPRGPRSGLLRQ